MQVNASLHWRHGFCAARGHYVTRLLTFLLVSSREYGFFYVRNSGVSPKLVQQHFEQSWAFFQLPLDVKASLTDVRPSHVQLTCIAVLVVETCLLASCMKHGYNWFTFW